MRAAAASSSPSPAGDGAKKKTPPAAAAAASSAAAALSPPPPPPSFAPANASDDAPVFVDREGVAIRVMPWDYGFRSGAARTGGVVGGTGGGKGPRPSYASLRSPSPVRVAATLAALSSRDGDASDGDDSSGGGGDSSLLRGKVPASLGAVARANFRAELFALRASFRGGGGDYRGIADAAAPTAGPARRLLGAAGVAVARALARADRALEEAGALPRLDLGSGTTVGAGATSAATASASSSAIASDECSTSDVEDADYAACAEAAAEADASAPWRRALAALDELTLDDHAVAARGSARDAALRRMAAASPSPSSDRLPKSQRAPWPVRLPFEALCWLLDVLYAGRPLQRFWVLETVARVPYFAYISVLHAYESVGLWRAGAELRRVHFAEEYNELHHLQIMVSFIWVVVFVRGGPGALSFRLFARRRRLF